jgi:energy-coupling factor transport system permease protein
MSDNIIDKISMEYIKGQVIKNAYGNDDTFIAKRDPRVLLIWYLFFGLVPWFLNDVFVLLSLFAFVTVTTKMAKIAPLIMFLFILGVFTQSGYLLIATFIFGGDVSAIYPLLMLTLKVSIVSLASITVFSGLDPDRLAAGLLYFGFPDTLAISISFGYRVLPMLMEEFSSILLSYKLRGLAPKGKFRYLFYQIKLIIVSFYPLMLNTAKKSRTTVEALELKGYRYALKNKKVKKMKLKMLRINRADILFSIFSVTYIIIIFSI